MLIPGDVPDIDVVKVQRTIKNEEDVLILDVRTPAEYSRGHIEGSINIPVDDIPTQAPKTIKDKNRVIYVYCLSGSRSTLACAELLSMGYKNTKNIRSGLLAWRTEGYQLSIID